MLRELFCIFRIKKIRDTYDHHRRKNKFITEILRLFTKCSSRKEYFDGVLDLVRKWTKCRCVGIRLLDREGNIPYESHFGFSEEFWSWENWLSIKTDGCACIRVITGETEPQDVKLMTKDGSFCCNHLANFFEELSPDEREGFRGRCVEAGFLTLGIIQIKYQDEVLGAIHLADEQSGKLKPYIINFLEEISHLMGEAVYKYNIEEELRNNYTSQKIINSELGITLNELRKTQNELVKNRDNLEELVKERTHELQIANSRLYLLLDSLPGFVYLQEKDNTITFINKRFKEIFGDTNNKPCYQLFHKKTKPCKECLNKNILAAGISTRTEKIIGKKMYEFWGYPFIDINGSPVVLKIGFDITDKKRMEKEIARLDMLNMIGAMSAGIAHEVRNPMTSVRGFLQIFKGNEQYSADRDYFDLMINELDRANAIITEFLALSRSKPAELKLCNLNNIISLLTPLLNAEANQQEKNIDIKLMTVPDLFLCDKEIRQVLLNLTRNALEAIPRGKTVFINTYSNDKNVILSIIDQGTGIEQNIIDKLGTPFLTTKENGTGLGLATCYSIAKRHNAVIDVQTSSGGTKFSIKFKITN